MDSPLSTLGFVIFGITFSIYSGIAKSHSPSLSVLRPSSPPLSLPSPPPHTPRTPRPLGPPRSLSPQPFSRQSSSPPNLAHADPEPKSKTSPAKSKQPRHHSSPPRPSSRSSPPRPPSHSSPPRPPSHRMKGGKKIGLLFAGFAGIMQIGVVGFLVFKRRKLLRTKDAFEASA